MPSREIKPVPDVIIELVLLLKSPSRLNSIPFERLLFSVDLRDPKVSPCPFITMLPPPASILVAPYKPFTNIPAPFVAALPIA